LLPDWTRALTRRRPATTSAPTTIVAAVAILFVALSLADGGYSHQLIGGVTAAIWLAIGLALALGRLPRARIPGSAIAAGVCLACFAAWTALSVVWASDKGGAFVEAVRVFSYLGLFVLVVATSPRGSARAWLTGLAIGLTVVAGLALVSRFEPSFGDHPLAGQAVPSAGGRLSYPIGYWNGLAACMALALVLLTWLGAQARTPPGRAAAVAAIPLPILTIYLSASRGGAAVAALGLATLVALGPERARMLGGLLLGGAGGALLVVIAHPMDALVLDVGNSAAARQGDELLAITLLAVAAVAFLRLWADGALAQLRIPRRVVIAALVATGIAVVAAVAAANPAARWDDFKAAGNTGEVSQSHLVSDSSSGRYQYWSAALDAFSSSPVEGIGAGGYAAWWAEHGTLQRLIRDAHSLFLETLGELGIVGFAILVTFFVIVAVAGARARTRWGGAELGAALALLAAGVGSAATDWTWELPACFGPAVVVAGLLTGPAAEPPAARSSPRGTWGSSANPRLGLGIVTLLVAWVAIWAGGVLFLTEFKLSSSRDAAKHSDLVAAADDARQASALQPWASEPRLQLALIQAFGHQFHAASRSLDEAIDRAPDDFRLWLVKTQLEQRLGHKGAAKRAFNRARQLNSRVPLNPFLPLLGQ
jgi:O-antigen ligase/polysaccharide polymerase Wzy-like membrane protein